jgi:metacaspase-1
MMLTDLQHEEELAVDLPIENKGNSFAKGHALVVAVANYDHVNTLPKAVLEDARDIVSVMTSPDHCGYEPKNVNLLLDGAATLTRLREALASLANTCQPDSTVVFFFSGHGALIGDPTNPTSALLPVDCKLSDVDATSLSETEFSSALRNIKAQRIVVLLDSCHSGGAGSFKGGPDHEASRLGYNEKTLGRLAQGTGRVLIASSRAAETSLVLAGARNSVFTHHLLEALRGEGRTLGDGVIRIFEIFNHVAERVGHSVAGRQHPIFKASDLEDNFPVALYRGGAKKAGPDRSQPTTLEDKWTRLGAILAALYPMGPTDQEIWVRAGGDSSRLHLSSTGRANWFSALRTLQQGGGGAGIQQHSLIRVALEDYPHHSGLIQLMASF